MEDERRHREVLVDDLEGYREALATVRAAAQSGDLAQGQATLATMRRRLGGTVVQRDFVERKLRRMEASLSGQALSPSRRALAREVFAQVHTSFFAAKYDEANRHLNALSEILHGAE